VYDDVTDDVTYTWLVQLDTGYGRGNDSSDKIRAGS